MVEEQAVVVDIDNEDAMLEVIRRTPCSLCGQTRGCGVSLWGKLFRHRPHIFKAANQVKARVGDLVIVGIEFLTMISCLQRLSYDSNLFRGIIH